MYLIKCLKRTSLHIGLCLLLTCFANVASAQSFELNLANLQQNGLTIRFDVTFGSTLTGVQRITPLIEVEGNDVNIRSFMLLSNLQCTNFNNDNNDNSVRELPSTTNAKLYQVCLGEGTRATLELKVQNPDMPRNITIRFSGSNSSQNLPRGSTVRQGPFSTLMPTVDPAILIRSKVFLEGPLQ